MMRSHAADAAGADSTEVEAEGAAAESAEAVGVVGPVTAAEAEPERPPFRDPAAAVAGGHPSNHLPVVASK